MAKYPLEGSSNLEQALNVGNSNQQKTLNLILTTHVEGTTLISFEVVTKEHKGHPKIWPTREEVEYGRSVHAIFTKKLTNPTKA